MPGCTAPNCSNSTQKGFKLYHFPSDPERCSLWVKNCGREEGWTPTRHTCVCEVHFEESQFELHRADGLRKLKPYAVPTKFDYSASTLRSRRKKSNNEHLKFSDNPELDESQEKIKSEKRISRISSRGASPSASRINKSQVKRVRFRKAFMSIGSNKKKKRVANISKKNSFNNESQPSLEYEMLENPQSGNEANICFVCNTDQIMIPKNACTPTSKIRLTQKLVQLVSVEFDLLAQDIEAVCINCAQVLNCIDYIENVHSNLSKGMLNLMKRKFCMEPTEHESELINLKLYMKSLKNLTVSFPWAEKDGSHLSWTKKDVLVTSELHHSHQPTETLEIADQRSERENEGNNIEHHESSTTENGPKELSTVKKYECEMCSFKTQYKAFMIFHIRQHFQKHYTCDFCSSPVSFNPSTAKELQTSDVRYKAKKHSECKCHKSNETSFPQFSWSLTNYQRDNCDSLEKRNILGKRKGVNIQERDKTIKKKFIFHKK